jgi:hypothetical protein
MVAELDKKRKCVGSMARRSELTADTTQLAKFLDITPRWVRHLKAEGILKLARDADGKELKGRYELLANNIAYIRHLREQAKLGDTSQAEFNLHRNRRVAADAERAELELKLFKGSVHRADDVEVVLTTRITAAKSRILAIAPRVTRTILGETDFQTVHDKIYAECESACNEIAGLSRKDFRKQTEEYLRKQASQCNGE